MHLLVHLRQFNHTERASCIHFLDVKEDLETEHHNSSSLESSVELARVATEEATKVRSAKENAVKPESNNETNGNGNTSEHSTDGGQTTVDNSTKNDPNEEAAVNDKVDYLV